MRVWFARVVAVLALAAATAALILAVNSVQATGDLSREDAQDAMGELNAANRRVSDRLLALEPGASPRDAQASVRGAADLTQRLAEDVDGEGALAERLEDVMRAQFEYLDAVGSTLNNPSSPLRGRIGSRSKALRQALKTAPGGDPQSVRGSAKLVGYSKARVEE